jgi:hypothetical protein
VSLTYRIIPAHGLVHVRYDGLIDFVETGILLARYFADPDYRPAQKQLIDFTRATALDTRFVEMMALNARTTKAVTPVAETLLAFYAPTPAAVRLARTGLSAWTAVPGVVARICTDEPGLTAFLGLPKGTLTALLDPATP